MGRLSMRVVLPLLIALAVSLLPWAFAAAVLHNATGADVEGALYLAAFVGAISFAVTGPLAFMTLKSLTSAKPRITFPWFVALYAVISVPTISFQVIAFSASIMELFIPGGPWRMSDTQREMTESAIACGIWYLAYFLVLLTVSKRAPYWTTAAGIVSGACSFGLIIFRALHA